MTPGISERTCSENYFLLEKDYNFFFTVQTDLSFAPLCARGNLCFPSWCSLMEKTKQSLIIAGIPCVKSDYDYETTNVTGM